MLLLSQLFNDKWSTLFGATVENEAVLYTFYIYENEILILKKVIPHNVHILQHQNSQSQRTRAARPEEKIN